MFGRNTDDTAIGDSDMQTASAEHTAPPAPADESAHQNTVVAPSGSSWQHPGAPMSSSSAPADISTSTDTPVASTAPSIDEPLGDAPKPLAAEPHLSDNPPAVHHDIADVSSSDLVSIKTQALSQLSPLMSHLDQTPEEKFRTTMMMIQASDDQGLVKEAFEAAQKITDDKARAQALLDVINEINYFTQQNDAS